MKTLKTYLIEEPDFGSKATKNTTKKVRFSKKRKTSYKAMYFDTWLTKDPKMLSSKIENDPKADVL